MNQDSSEEVFQVFFERAVNGEVVGLFINSQNNIQILIHHNKEILGVEFGGTEDWEFTSLEMKNEISAIKTYTPSLTGDSAVPKSLLKKYPIIKKYLKKETGGLTIVEIESEKGFEGIVLANSLKLSFVGDFLPTPNL